MDINLYNVSKGLFVTDVIFILLIFSMFSLGILKAFQNKFRAAVIYAVLGIISSIVFYFILRTWFL